VQIFRKMVRIDQQLKSPVRANIQENGQNRPTVKSPGPCLVRCEICENLLYNCKSKIRRT
jgi:hypothetical protein